MLIPSALLLLSGAQTATYDQVANWALKADAASCRALELSLTNPTSSQLRDQAAVAIYARCGKPKVRAAQLCKQVEMGTASAAPYLLLSYAEPRDQAQSCLAKGPRKGWEMVKLAQASRPVPATLAATVALARLGVEDSIAGLRAAFARNETEELLFLFAALAEVEDAESLNAVRRLLDDTREIPGVKSESKRRLRDAAADALRRKYGLMKPGEYDGKRYSDAELAALKKIGT